MRTINRDQSVRCGRGLALVTIITIAAGVLLAGTQPANAQAPGTACTVNGKPGVYVCPPGSFANGFICQNLTPPPGELPAICQATGPSPAELLKAQQKQATVVNKITQPRTTSTLTTLSVKSSQTSQKTASQSLSTAKTLVKQVSQAIVYYPPKATKVIPVELPPPAEGKPPQTKYKLVPLSEKEKAEAAEARKRFEQAKKTVTYVDLAIDEASPEYSGWSGRRFRLGMDVGTARFDVFAIGEGAFADIRGVDVKDAAGLVKPGTPTPNSRSTSAGAGVRGSVDASRWFGLTGDQSLIANGFVAYSRTESKSGTTAELAAVGLANSGSANADNVTVGGDVRYEFNSLYIQGAADLNFGRVNVANTVDASNGDFDSRWYNVDLRIGKSLPLALGVFGPYVYSGGSTREPWRPAGVYIVGLDVSGHIGHSDLHAGAFTDSTGLTYGTERTRYETAGGRVELFATIIYNKVLWVPYVAMKVDQRFDFSSAAYFPVQPDLPNGNVVYYGGANTFWGPELGLTIAAPAWWSIQARGFYLASADTNVAGGSVQVRIPFNP